MKSFHCCLAALVASSIWLYEERADETERRGCGIRAGIDVVIVEKPRINTSRAVIKIRL